MPNDVFVPASLSSHQKGKDSTEAIRELRTANPLLISVDLQSIDHESTACIYGASSVISGLGITKSTLSDQFIFAYRLTNEPMAKVEEDSCRNEHERLLIT